MKYAVITGGTGGLGSAIATAFRQPDWSVEALGSRELDVRQPSEISSYFAGRSVDLLICAAGNTRDALISRIDETNWDETIAVNFTGAKLCADAVIPEMIRQGQGHIIFISSYSAVHPPAGQLAYATAKSALLGLTTELAAQNGYHNIRVNAILPGFLETPMTDPIKSNRRAEILSAHHLGRLNTPQIVASFIHHLQENLPHTSGQIFQLDSRPR